jgi:hypothetical protein
MTRLERLATARGLTVVEYLMEHLDYKLSRHERKNFIYLLLKAAARCIEEHHQHEHVHSARRP